MTNNCLLRTVQFVGLQTVHVPFSSLERQIKVGIRSNYTNKEWNRFNWLWMFSTVVCRENGI